MCFEISRAALARGLPHGARKRRRARARNHTYDVDEDVAAFDTASSEDGDHTDDGPEEEQGDEGAAKETDSHRYWRIKEQGWRITDGDGANRAAQLKRSLDAADREGVRLKEARRLDPSTNSDKMATLEDLRRRKRRREQEEHLARISVGGISDGNMIGRTRIDLSESGRPERSGWVGGRGEQKTKNKEQAPGPGLAWQAG